jgi:iron complex transport system ATP-binding protein
MLRVTDISASFCLTDGLSIQVDKGQAVALIGPNGAGKSTLINTILGLNHYSSGSISLLGKDLTSASPRWIAQKMAVVHQHEARPTGFSVEQLVAMGRYPHESLFNSIRGHGHEAVKQALDIVQLTALKARDASTLSGGEYQRMRIGRALAQEPQLLILDEPLAHLDIGNAHQIASIIRSLNLDQEITILAAIHDLNIAALYFDRIILLVEGDVWADGSVDDVMTTNNLERAFKIPFVVQEHPTRNRPQFFAIPKT